MGTIKNEKGQRPKARQEHILGTGRRFCGGESTQKQQILGALSDERAVRVDATD
jgi:hypothetical protein